MDPVWEKLHSSRHWGKYPADDVIRTLMRQFPDPEQRAQTAVLELGCGAGANLTFLLQEGFQVHAVDGAPSAIAKSRAHVATYARPGQACELRVADFKKLDYANARFDVVVDCLAVYANPMETVRTAVAEARRVLKPGGYFYSSVFGSRTFGAASGGLLEPGTLENPTAGPCKDLGTSHFFTEAELRTLYAGWASLTLRRVVTDIPGDATSVIEEWVAWALK